MQMRLQNFEPLPQLKGYVEKIWVFESSGRMPDDDMKLIVPNGMDFMYRHFYDQAHFIKEFKRFTGYSPLRFSKSENEFGRIFYKE
ncbi:MAG TPA: hypothetical protein VKZ68_01020 [Ohtaekwangia sp.]|nr:hypothetical protein [Ohtaekwangia sp.]